MKSGKLTNTLLALIFLALLAHLVVPLLAAREAIAVSGDAKSPSAVAAGAGFPALDKLASEVGNGLNGIAQSNQQIADAIREHARSAERIAQSLDAVAREVKTLDERPASRAHSQSSPTEPTPEQELDKDWWRGQIPE